MAADNSVHIVGTVKRDESAKELGGDRSVMDFCLMVPDPHNEGLDVYVDCFASTETVRQLDGFVSEGERIGVDGFVTFRTFTDYRGRRKSGLVVYAERAYEIGE